MRPTENSHNLFLSYNSKDRKHALEIATKLRKLEVRAWLDEKEIMPGQNFMDELEAALETIPAGAILIGVSGFGKWQKHEMRKLLSNYITRGNPVIPILLPGVTGAPKLPLFLEPIVWLDLRNGITTKALQRMVETIKTRIPVKLIGGRTKGSSLSEILGAARKRLIISGHTLDKFSKDPSEDAGVRQAFLSSLHKGVKVTVIQLNPRSPYAHAHQPYHRLESTSTPQGQHSQALKFFAGLFLCLDEEQIVNLEVLFSHYMPRFRTIIVDDDVYLYFYMYGTDVSAAPDLMLNAANDQEYPGLRKRILDSTARSLLEAPEIVPYIRFGRLYDYWKEMKLTQWGYWSQREREHHDQTYRFYVTNGKRFHERWGWHLENYVKSHLDVMHGRTLVLGCGSGKEVDYLAKKAPDAEILGVDFSPPAIQLARRLYPGLADRFIIGDLYDLPHLVSGLFDSIVANASFVHLYTRGDIETVLQEVFRKLAPGGRFFLRALYKEEGDGTPIYEGTDVAAGPARDWCDNGRWFVYYSRSELRRSCETAGFKVLEDITLNIARAIGHSGSSGLKTIREKGFNHEKWDAVKWPTLMLEKPGTR